MVISLDDLKAENAKADANADTENTETDVELEDVPQTEEDEADVEVVEDELEEAGEDAETSEEETDETETEDWMQGDDHESPDAEKKFTDSDVGKAKSKLRAKLEKKHQSEIEALRKEIEELKSKPGQQRSEGLQRPKRDDFLDADNPDEAYFDALTDYKIKKSQEEANAKQAAQQTEASNRAYFEKVEQAVDQHYERAQELAKKSGIKPEMYQAADLVVRQAVESVFKDAGDEITDALIAKLGAGSEKVMYNLGINTARREKFIELLKNDPSGIEASMYLAERKAELNATKRRKTNAPEPSPQLNGNKQKKPSGRALKKKYQEAHKSGNVQSAFDAKRAARKAGIDTSDW